jgi:acetate kinase
VRVLLLNAGSNSLKCAVLEAEGGRVVGLASADWAGPVTCYAHSEPEDLRALGTAPGATS